MRTPLHPAREDFSLPNILYALGDPARLNLVAQLDVLSGEVNCHSLIDLHVPKATGSHRLKVLREAGLIRMVPQGRQTLLSLRRDDLEARFPGLLESILRAYRNAPQ